MLIWLRCFFVTMMMIMIKPWIFFFWGVGAKRKLWGKMAYSPKNSLLESFNPTIPTCIFYPIWDTMMKLKKYISWHVYNSTIDILMFLITVDSDTLPFLLFSPKLYYFFYFILSQSFITLYLLIVMYMLLESRY